MEQEIKHSHLPIRGLRLHIAHAGHGEKGAVVFLHGFPEIWYTWRHQILAVADAGYHAIAPDFRGYGLSEQPKEPEDSTWEDLTLDLLAILDSLEIPKAFVVGKDFGVKPAYDFALRYPHRVSGVVIFGIPYRPTGFGLDLLPTGFYVRRWMEPGRAEADFGRFDVKTVIRNIYILFSGSDLPIAADGQEIMDLVQPDTPLPPWLSEDGLQTYADLYEKSGFRLPLQIPYRKRNKIAPVPDPKIEAPTLLIMGEKDYTMKFPGLEEYARSGAMKRYAPDLEVAYMPEGSHFVPEQFPEQVNQLIVAFIDSHHITK